MTDIHALTFNAITRGLAEFGRFVSLAEREAIAAAVKAAIEPEIRADERERIASHMDALAGASGGSSHFAYRNAAHEIREGQSAPEEPAS